MAYSPAAQDALSVLRSPAYYQWYVVPLLVFVIWVYLREVRERKWDRVATAIAFFAGEFVWEMFNACVCYFSGYSALWVVAGPSAYVVLVGLTIEIMFFFALMPFIVFDALDACKDGGGFTVAGRRLPSKVFVPLLLGLACVAVEVILNQWGALVWDWPFWNWPNCGLQIVAYTLPIYGVAWAYYRMSLRAKKIAAVGAVALAIILFALLVGLAWI